MVGAAAASIFTGGAASAAIGGFGGSIVGGAAGGAAGSLFSQGANALLFQTSFSWQGLAEGIVMGAAGGAVRFALGEGTGQTQTTSTGAANQVLFASNDGVIDSSSALMNQTYAASLLNPSPFSLNPVPLLTAPVPIALPSVSEAIGLMVDWPWTASTVLDLIYPEWAVYDILMGFPSEAQ
jgi:hypothetical protein